MDARDIYTKLEKMSEQISRLRESSARTETLLNSLTSLDNKVEDLISKQNQWKGAFIVVSALFSVIASIVMRVVFK